MNDRRAGLNPWVLWGIISPNHKPTGLGTLAWIRPFLELLLFKHAVSQSLVHATFHNNAFMESVSDERRWQISIGMDSAFNVDMQCENKQIESGWAKFCSLLDKEKCDRNL